MERLTFEGNFCDIAQCRELPCPCNGECSQRKVWERLKAYEDKVKTPEEVLPKDKADEIALKLMRIADLESLCNYTRLRELADADKDGRLIVLPCKVGDTVYLIVTKRAKIYMPEFSFVKKSRLTFLNMERVLQDFGKTVFLTREEAEKALEAME